MQNTLTSTITPYPLSDSGLVVRPRTQPATPNLPAPNLPPQTFNLEGDRTAAQTSENSNSQLPQPLI